MDFGLEGKVAMVAAGSKGIGFAIAKLLLEEGCMVSICSRSEENLDVAMQELGDNCRGYVCNVAVSSDLEWWLSETQTDLGQVEILVTNTGGPPAGSIRDMTDEQWQEGVDGTLMNVIRLSRLVTPGMIERRWGRVVHLTSLVAKEPSLMLPISSTLRAGLMAFVRLQSTELAPYGVTANCVLPGHTLTDRQRHLASLIAGQKQISEEAALVEQGQNSNPMRRLADPEEVAAAVGFLCSKQASFISGINLLADGGGTRGLA